MEALDPDGLVEADLGTTTFPHERCPANVSTRLAPQTQITRDKNQPQMCAQYLHGKGSVRGFIESCTGKTV